MLFQSNTDDFIIGNFDCAKTVTQHVPATANKATTRSRLESLNIVDSPFGVRRLVAALQISLHLGDEPLLLFINLCTGCRPRQDQQAMPERHTLLRLEREIQFLLAVAEHFLSEWIRRKQSIATRVPV